MALETVWGWTVLNRDGSAIPNLRTAVAEGTSAKISKIRT